ncbi:MAG: hypothetical protein QNJ51_27440 [Calothrix sp. MO_167.B12]|nr:hypothetical protein [Calothrix sp. MO_167.B12]
MKSKRKQTIGIGSTLVGAGLVQATPLLAHEKRFHVPNKTTKPKSEPAQTQKTPATVMPEVQVQEESSNPPQEKVFNSIHAVQSNEINILIQPGEVVFLLLIFGTFLLFYVKRWMYRKNIK